MFIGKVCNLVDLESFWKNLGAKSVLSISICFFSFSSFSFTKNYNKLAFTTISSENNDGRNKKKSNLPKVKTKNFTVYLDRTGNASITTKAIDNGSYSANPMELSIDKNQFDVKDVGDNKVILTAVDNFGNRASESAVVRVIDNIEPVVITVNRTLRLNDQGYAVLSPNDVNNGSIDASGIQSLSIYPDTFSIKDVGQNACVFTAVDMNGNMAKTYAYITIVDQTAPELATKNIRKELNLQAEVEIEALEFVKSAFDYAGIAEYSVYPSKFGLKNLGENKVTITAMDSNGNFSAQKALLLIEDTRPPILLVKELLVQLNEHDEVTVSPKDLNNGSFDASGVRLSLNKTSFNYEHLGINEVTVTAVDASGNSSSIQTTITVIANFYSDQFSTLIYWNTQKSNLFEPVRNLINNINYGT